MSDYVEDTLNRYEKLYEDALKNIDENYSDDYDVHKHLRAIWMGKLEVIRQLKYDLLD